VVFGRRRSWCLFLLFFCCFVWVVILLFCCCRVFICFVCVVISVFSFILLSVLHHLPAITWFDFEVEMWVLAFIWFFAVLALQLSFFSDGCFIRIGLFTEFLCNLYRLVRPWNRPGLPLVLLELLVNTIASCSVLLDRIQNLSLYLHCFLSFGLCCWGALSFRFGFIVGEPTPFSFIGFLISSSFRIRNEKNPSL
jgi:hypothetical protein